MNLSRWVETMSHHRAENVSSTLDDQTCVIWLGLWSMIMFMIDDYDYDY
jgi:hypothetical protein